MFEHINRRLETVLENIRKLDVKEELEGLSMDDKVSRDVLKEEYERTLAMEELLWKQKSRIQLLKERDKILSFS